MDGRVKPGHDSRCIPPRDLLPRAASSPGWNRCGIVAVIDGSMLTNFA